MGVYIESINKPKECKHCRFTYIYEHSEAGDYEVCQFIPGEPIPQAGRDNRCPLIEISEGCISKEGLSDEVERYYAERGDFGSFECSWILGAIKNAPSVVPSRAKREEKYPCALCKYHYDEGDLMVCMRCPAEPRMESGDK